ADGFEKLEVLDEDRMRAVQLALDAETGRRHLGVALGGMEAQLQLVLDHADIADLLQEVAMPGGALILAVSGELEPDLLLHLDDRAHRILLDAAKLLGGQFLAREFLARLDQRLRAQKAADMIGAKRRCGT